MDDTRKPPSANWDWARNVKEAIYKLQHEDREYDHMSLDHDLSMSKYKGKVVVNPSAMSGGDFVLWLHEHGDKKHMPKSINLHTHNERSVALMKKALEPHTKVTAERAPDGLEEEWAKEYKVHEPSEIKEEEIHLPEKAAVAEHPPDCDCEVCKKAQEHEWHLQHDKPGYNEGWRMPFHAEGSLTQVA